MKPGSMKVVLPLLVVAVGVVVALIMIRTRPRMQTLARQAPPPLVRVLTVHKQDVRLKVHSQGSVVPRTETTLVPQISGRIIDVSASFVTGGFFEASEVLLTIDPTDFELALVRARSEVAQAEVRLAREEAEAAVARREWSDLGEGEGAPLVVREPQLAEARAALEAARARLEQTAVNLERTRIRAPFAGRVREKNVDLGTFVIPGQRLAQVYAIDHAEVRLPLPDEDLAYVDLPLSYREDDRAPADDAPRGDDHLQAGDVSRASDHPRANRDGARAGDDSQVARPDRVRPPDPSREATAAAEARARTATRAPTPASRRWLPKVVLRARFAGRTHEWEGRIVRTEGEIDPQSRMIHAVAQVDDPYGRGEDPDRPPLAVGLFVEAEIFGRHVSGVVVLPRAAMRGRDQVLVVDADDRLRFRTVDVLRSHREDVIVRAGLRDGERVCLSPLAAVTDGMKVRTVETGAGQPLIESPPAESPAGSSPRSSEAEQASARSTPGEAGP